MDESRRLERLPRALLGQLYGGELPQLLVDEGQELLGGVGIALLDGRQDAGYLTHRGHRKAQIYRINNLCKISDRVLESLPSTWTPLMTPPTATSSATPRRVQKADVADRPEAFHHVGLLVNGPPGTAGLPFT
jgi:hypothetical protein